MENGRVNELVKAFLSVNDRVKFYLEATDRGDTGTSKHSMWMTQLCTPTSAEIEALVGDEEIVYSCPTLVRLLFRDDTFKDVRDFHIRLVDALESQRSRQIIDQLFEHLDKFSAEDRARGFLLLASEASSEESGRQELLDRIVESFDSSPRDLRPQLLLAASTIGHEPMAYTATSRHCS
ncbi:hypothetical protein GN244_ATG04489 [Phytophthora infestans]|uniref:Uncharacterized protein n=1 Tax=Phytophthora infestans TaxID=4787 RepID=A0A833TLX2_PHYIN|nr:hypothetical protein GN244_ATG04489 [Phytophthora infestans]